MLISKEGEDLQGCVSFGIQQRLWEAPGNLLISAILWSAAQLLLGWLPHSRFEWPEVVLSWDISFQSVGRVLYQDVRNRSDLGFGFGSCVVDRDVLWCRGIRVA